MRIAELIVAAAFLGVGIVAVAALTAASARVLARAAALDETYAVLGAFADSVRAEAAPGSAPQSGRRTLARGTLEWRVQRSGRAWVRLAHAALEDPVELRFAVLPAGAQR